MDAALLAIFVAFVGFVATFIVTKELAHVTFLGEPASYDRAAAPVIEKVFAASLIGGSIAWCIGGFVGWWCFVRPAMEPTRELVRLLGVATVPLMFTGIVFTGIAARAVYAENRTPYYLMFTVGAAFVIGMLVILALRGKSRRATAFRSAIVGIWILFAAGIWLSRVLPWWER